MSDPNKPAVAKVAEQLPDMRITDVPLGGGSSCAGCGAPTDKHLYLGTICTDGTRLGNSRPICFGCRATLASVLIDGMELH